MFEMVITVDPIIQGLPNVGTSLHTTQGGHYPNIPSSVEYKTDLCEKYNQLISNSSFEHDINLFVYFIYQIYVFKQMYLGVICLIIDAFNTKLDNVEYFPIHQLTIICLVCRSTLYLLISLRILLPLIAKM